MTKVLPVYYPKLLIFFFLQGQKYFHVLTDFELYFISFPESDMPSCITSNIFILFSDALWEVEVIVTLFEPSDLLHSLQLFKQNFS